MVDCRLPPQHRLKRPADFQRVYDHRCSVSDDWLIIYGRANDLSHHRVGLSVSRKFGPAVQRNRLKRLYREAFRTSQWQWPGGLDLVLIPRGSATPTLAQLQTSLSQLIPQLAKRLARRDKPT